MENILDFTDSIKLVVLSYEEGCNDGNTSNVSRNLLSGASNAANFLLSPMRRASLKSPRHKNNQKVSQDA
jgi:hypothetical protein